jgi:ankyrin repeat protein
MVELLLSQGADINIKNDKGWAPLHFAIFFKQPAIVKLLLDKNVDIEEKVQGVPPLIGAVENPEIANILIEKGADIKARDGQGWTALFYAVDKGRLDMVKLFLDKGADIHTKSNNGDSLLVHAIDSNQPDIVEFLLQNGLDINERHNIVGTTPLMAAAVMNREKIAAILINKGANITAQLQNGDTALALAIQKGHKNIVKLLQTANS